jgi:hypothetical protein
LTADESGHLNQRVTQTESDSIDRLLHVMRCHGLHGSIRLFVAPQPGEKASVRLHRRVTPSERHAADLLLAWCRRPFEAAERAPYVIVTVDKEGVVDSEFLELSDAEFGRALRKRNLGGHLVRSLVAMLAEAWESDKDRTTERPADPTAAPHSGDNLPVTPPCTP